MKRGGDKKGLLRKKASSHEATFKPWVGWQWLTDGVVSHRENQNRKCDCEELKWVRNQVESMMDVCDISNILPPSRISTPPSMIFLASSNRNDPIDRVAAELQKRFPTTSVRVVLGQWWAGHRRTWPIANGLASIYWYQCHDVLMPELLIHSKGAVTLQSEGDRLALIVSEDSAMRQMWLDVLPGLGFQSFAVCGTEALPEGQVDAVFFDPKDAHRQLDRETTAGDDLGKAALSESVAILRRTYPCSKIVVCLGFPRWDEVSRIIESGADLIVGKPFRLEGLSKILIGSVRT